MSLKIVGLQLGPNPEMSVRPLLSSRATCFVASLLVVIEMYFTSPGGTSWYIQSLLAEFHRDGQETMELHARNTRCAIMGHILFVVKICWRKVSKRRLG